VQADLVLAHAYDRLSRPSMAIRHAQRARTRCAEMGVPVPADRYRLVDGPASPDRVEVQAS
jgi:hypothetical protein